MASSSLPRARFLSRRQRGRLWFGCCIGGEGKGQPNLIAASRRIGGKLRGGGGWGLGEEGGGEGVAHKQQWMVHPLC